MNKHNFYYDLVITSYFVFTLGILNWGFQIFNFFSDRNQISLVDKQRDLIKACQFLFKVFLSLSSMCKMYKINLDQVGSILSNISIRFPKLPTWSFIYYQVHQGTDVSNKVFFCYIFLFSQFGIVGKPFMNKDATRWFHNV